MSVKRLILIALAAAILVTAAGAIFFLLTFTGPIGEQLTLRPDPVSSRPTVHIDPENVSQEAPRFHRLLEKAVQDNGSQTTDYDTVWEGIQYVQRVSGLPAQNFNVEYRGRVFAMNHIVT